MTIVNVLISSLEEWDKLTGKEQINDFKGLIDSILLHLGVISETSIKSKIELLVDLQERIRYLVEEEGIDQDLLVMGLVNFISEKLERTLMRQGQTIVLDEKLISSDKVDLDMKNRLSYSLKELKRDNFYEKATKELDHWRFIVASNFTKGNRARWRKEGFEVVAEDLEEELSQIPKKILDILFDIPIVKLIAKIELEDIKNLSCSEAMDLREVLI
ncbi:hypothetical protein BX659_102124 [Orenia metallireducens]|jgi:hypothetical protein|uniref:Uncharacterized protein n=1 Tax=Orenia metallireducens TaxID=1413210 RepID=A0A285F323_9FIRM|nr:hypothetical protein [Orenia metallireducens]PRX34809.1 hypothetical protein BX659_102124 [Orenia metallireducens]SNY05709.1 hypothetical protein SAMN06265827_101123 [Orenia metallireducens]